MIKWYFLYNYIHRFVIKEVKGKEVIYKLVRSNVLVKCDTILPLHVMQLCFHIQSVTSSKATSQVHVIWLQVEVCYPHLLDISSSSPLLHLLHDILLENAQSASALLQDTHNGRDLNERICSQCGSRLI